MLNTLANESSPLPPEEPGRAEILRHLKLADTQAGPAFDALVETVRNSADAEEGQPGHQ